MAGDSYGRKLYPYIDGTASKSPVPMQAYSSAEEFVRARAGETPNHNEQVIALKLAQNYELNRPLVIDYYGRYTRVVGFCAKGGTDEFASTSHWGHFGFAWGFITLEAARHDDWELLKWMGMVWGWSLNWARACRTPWYDVVSPGARYMGNANQTEECNVTHRWLETGNTGRKLIKTIAHAPSWGGLYCLLIFEKTMPELFARWVSKVREVKELPPLKNRLIVERYEHGHYAYYPQVPKKMFQPAVWAIANYRTREKRYGVPHLLRGGEQARHDNSVDANVHDGRSLHIGIENLGKLQRRIEFPVASSKS